MPRRTSRSDADGTEKGWERWQTLLAALVTALAAVAVAVIAALSGNGGSQSDQDPGQSPSTTSDAEPGELSIGSVTLLDSSAGGSLMRIVGTAQGVGESADIFVVGRPSDASGDDAPAAVPAPAPSSDAAVWLAAGPAERPTTTTWNVDFPVSDDVRRPLSFTAVVATFSCPPDIACSPIPPEQVVEILERQGPEQFLQSEAFVAP